MNDPSANRPPERWHEGPSAYLVVISLMSGFAFAGLVLYLGMAAPNQAEIVAAGLLLAAFVVLLYAAFACASVVDVIGRHSQRAIEHYQTETLLSMLLGILLLLAAISVMSFAWSPWLGALAVVLSALFIVRFVWTALREIHLAFRDRISNG